MKKIPLVKKAFLLLLKKMFHKHLQNSSSQEFGFTLTVNATALVPLTHSEYNH